jgi:hypothetical protein
MDNADRFSRVQYALGPLDFLRPAITALMAGEALAVSEQKLTIYL